MDFEIKECVEINFYYDLNEMSNEANKIKKDNGNVINKDYTNTLKRMVEHIKMGHTFLPIVGSVGNKYDMNVRKQCYIFSVEQEKVDLLKFELKEIFNIFIENAMNEKILDLEDVKNTIYLLEKVFINEKLKENLENKLKEKDITKKPKL